MCGSVCHLGKDRILKCDWEGRGAEPKLAVSKELQPLALKTLGESVSFEEVTWVPGVFVPLPGKDFLHEGLITVRVLLHSSASCLAALLRAWCWGPRGTHGSHTSG